MTRTASDIIDQALRENHRAQVLLYIFASLFILCGVGVMVFSLMTRQAAMGALTGIVIGSLSLPALNAARRIGRENMAILLLEVPLNKASTSAEAANMLEHLFVQLQSRDGSEISVNVNPSNPESIENFLQEAEKYADGVT